MPGHAKFGASLPTTLIGNANASNPTNRAPTSASSFFNNMARVPIAVNKVPGFNRSGDVNILLVAFEWSPACFAVPNHQVNGCAISTHQVQPPGSELAPTWAADVLVIRRAHPPHALFVVSQGKQRIDFAPHLAKGLVWQSGDYARVATPPIETLQLVRENHPGNGQPPGKGNFERIAFDLVGDRAKHR